MLRELACVVVFVILADAQRKPYCCVPKQWEGGEGYTQVVTNERSTGISFGNARISYCAKGKKIATSVTVFGAGPKPLKMHVLQDFPKGVAYVVDKEKKKCMKARLGPWEEFCMPGMATRMPYRYGAGNETLNNYAYIYKKKGTNVWALATQKGCYPVAMSLSGGSRKQRFVWNGGFNDVTLGIKDRSVFDVPAECKKTELVQETNFEPSPGMLGVVAHNEYIQHMMGADKDRIVDVNTDRMMDGEHRDHMMDGEHMGHMMDGEHMDHMMDGEHRDHMMDGGHRDHMADGNYKDRMMGGDRMGPGMKRAKDIKIIN